MIQENEMGNGEDFILGVDYIKRNSSFYHTYNPDKVNNFHLSISGTSGSGKTRMLKHLLRYLKKKNKHIHVIDVKGDLHIEGENYIDFPIRNQAYGINPFEFDKNIETGGIKKRSGEIVDMIIKAFNLRIGAAKKDVFARLITDTYALKGITENEDTWGLNLSKAEQAQMLPSVQDLSDLTNTILDAVNYGQANKLDTAMVKDGKKAIASSTKIRKIQAVIHQIKKKLKDYYYHQAATEQQKDENVSIESILDKLIKDDPQYKKIEELKIDIDKEQETIDEAKESFLGVASSMFDSFIYSGGNAKNASYESFVTEDDTLKHIDLKYYSKKSVLSMLESVSVYFEMLCSSGLFNKNIPPVKPGLNRYDISKHKQETQVFFMEVIAFKLFNATKLRGDYSNLPSSIREKRGEKNDTFLAIDEAQVVLPDVNSKEKESGGQIINRIASESRSKGLGLILVSQSLGKFSNVVNINIPNKIVFKTLGTDINMTKKLLNISDKNGKIFDMINTSFGVGLYVDEMQKNNIFLAPWYEKKDLQKVE